MCIFVLFGHRECFGLGQGPNFIQRGLVIKFGEHGQMSQVQLDALSCSATSRCGACYRSGTWPGSLPGSCSVLAGVHLHSVGRPSEDRSPILEVQGQLWISHLMIKILDGRVTIHFQVNHLKRLIKPLSNQMQTVYLVAFLHLEVGQPDVQEIGCILHIDQVLP